MDNREKQTTVAKYIVWVGMTLLGTFIMAIGYSVFLVPNNIVAGGFSGLAFLITQFLADIFGSSPISKGALYILLNVPLFIIGWKNLGKSFSFLALIGTLSFSLFMDIVKINVEVKDVLLSSLFGGILYGIGLGIVVRGNSSTGGTDMLGNILHNINYKITVGGCVIAIDFAVLLLSALRSDLL
ncbi:MAG: YitT family protein, partial [Clostridia bacterium]